MTELPIADADAATPIRLFGSASWDTLAPDLPDNVRTILERAGFRGATGDLALVPGPDGGLSGVYFGIGDPPAARAMPIRGLVARLPAGDYRFSEAPAGLDDNQVAVAWLLGAYRFTRYKPASGHGPARLAAAAGADFEEARSIASACALARDMVNTPANDMGPEQIETIALEVAAAHGAEVAVTRGDDLLPAGYPLVHAVGRAAPFRERPALSIQDLGRGARDFVLDADWMPDYLADKYADVTDALLEEVEDRARGWRGTVTGRILGDCHRGNILWTDAGPHFVDLDDCVSGPAIQDLWMLIAGNREEMAVELIDLLRGYEQFLPFNRRELALIEPLRALRMIHYSAWLARRWDDPAFPLAFPWFGTPRYWEEHYRALEDQLAQVLEPPLEL